MPQGSILCPEFFNYNSNDLFLFVLLEIANYADDNSPFSVAQSVPHVIDNLETDVKNLLSWIKYNGLKANPDKFHLLLSDTDETLSMGWVVLIFITRYLRNCWALKLIIR